MFCLLVVGSSSLGNLHKMTRDQNDLEEALSNNPEGEENIQNAQTAGPEYNHVEDMAISSDFWLKEIMLRRRSCSRSSSSMYVSDLQGDIIVHKCKKHCRCSVCLKCV